MANKKIKITETIKIDTSLLNQFIDKGMLVRVLDGIVELSYRGYAVEAKPNADLVETAQNLLDKMG
jgi:hypothetical protein